MWYQYILLLFMISIALFTAYKILIPEKSSDNRKAFKKIDDLTEQEKYLLHKLSPGWGINMKGQLVKKYKLSNGDNLFDVAFHFAEKIRILANNNSHHPEIMVSWGKITVKLWSFDEKKLTEKDGKLAQQIDDLYRAISILKL